jgi:hypothetical protein
MPQANLPFAGAGALLVVIVVAGCANLRGLQCILSLSPGRVRRSPDYGGRRRGGGRGLLGDDGALLGRGVLNDVELLGESRSGQGEQQSCSESVSTHGILLIGSAPTPKLNSKFRPSRATLDRQSEHIFAFRAEEALIFGKSVRLQGLCLGAVAGEEPRPALSVIRVQLCRKVLTPMAEVAWFV